MPVSLKPVFEKIQWIANTGSTNDKVALLREYLLDATFRKVIRLAYNQTYSYNVTSFPEFNPIGFCDRGFEFVLPILKELVLRNGADNVIKQRLFQSAAIDRETYEIVRRICNNDLKCGIGARLINIAVPGTVKIFSYMRCATSAYMHKIDFTEEAIVQCKADGSFANLIVDHDGSVKFITRNGQIIRCLEHLKSRIRSQKSIMKHGRRRGILHSSVKEQFFGKVFNGEFRVYEEDGSVMPRKKGNGIINQCIKGTVDSSIARRIFYTVWDCIPIEDFYNGCCDKVYRTRFFDTSSFINCVGDEKFFKVIEFQYVNSVEEAYAFFRKMRSSGEEGAIVKNLKGIWEDNQSGSHDCIKIKHSFECEVKVVGWKPGKAGTKYEHTVGSVLIESECGKLKCAVSGLLDEEREWDWDKLKGTVITVEAESVISSKSKDTHSLYSPSIVEPRTDRKKADSLERILEICVESKKTKRRKA